MRGGFICDGSYYEPAHTDSYVVIFVKKTGHASPIYASSQYKPTHMMLHSYVPVPYVINKTYFC